MAIKVPCTCGRPFSVDDSMAGTKVFCPVCGVQNTVPAMESSGLRGALLIAGCVLLLCGLFGGVYWLQRHNRASTAGTGTPDGSGVHLVDKANTGGHQTFGNRDTPTTPPHTGETGEKNPDTHSGHHASADRGTPTSPTHTGEIGDANPGTHTGPGRTPDGGDRGGTMSPRDRKQDPDRPASENAPEAKGGGGEAVDIAGQGASWSAGVIHGTIKVKGVKSARDIVVYVDRIADQSMVPAKPAEMRQKGLVFQPHVLAVLKGTTVEFLNDDNVQHNVFSPDDVMDKTDLGTFGVGERRSFTFKKTGTATILCKLHPEMEAVMVVLDSAWFAVSEGPEKGTDGTFTIKGVPAGTYTLKTWHDKLKEGTAQVTVQAGATAEVAIELKR